MIEFSYIRIHKEEIFPLGGRMPLNIKNDEAHEYAKKLSALTHKSITEAVTEALRRELDRKERKHKAEADRLVDDLDAIALRCASYPVIDQRSPDEILGYDDRGLPDR